VCQVELRNDCHAAFTVKGPGITWPVASWRNALVEEQINVRGWFALLDKIADEFLIWRPQGGCLFVYRDRVTYRIEESAPSVLFLQLEVNRLMVMPSHRAAIRRVSSAT
jgi:hypothetical protein